MKPNSDERWSAQLVGTMLFVTSERTGKKHEETICFFDDSAASEKLQQLVEEKRGEGFEESEATKAAALATEQELAEDAKYLATVRSLCARTDVPGALYEYLAGLVSTPRGKADLRDLCSLAVEIGDTSAGGFAVQLKGGGKLLVSSPKKSSDGLPIGDPPFSAIWCYCDEDESSYAHFGTGAEPPEPNFELEGTPYAGQEVTWFLEESPWDRYWFLHPEETNEDGRALLYCYEFDGGLHEPVDLGLGELLVQRFLGVMQSSASRA